MPTMEVVFDYSIGDQEVNILENSDHVLTGQYSSQQTHYAIMTSLLRHNDVIVT